MQGSFTESIRQACTDNDEAALTRSFASPAFADLAFYILSMLSLLGQMQDRPVTAGAL